MRAVTRAVNPEPPAVGPGDEGPHEPGPEPWWNESWYFDLADPRHRLGCFLRFGRYPNRGRTWFHLVVAGEDRPVLLVADEQAPLAAGPDLTLTTDGWTATLDASEPLRRWRVTARARARVLADPRAEPSGGTGPAADIALDLTWTTAADPYHYGVTTRYEITCTVAGTIAVGDEEVAIDGTGQRDHSWGVRDWWTFGWCWSAGAFPDGTAFHLADIRLPGHAMGFGYTVSDGSVVPASAVLADEEVDAEGVPLRARLAVDPGPGVGAPQAGLDAELSPVAVVPLVFVAGDGRVTRFPRALCRYRRADGVEGWGWTEWNQPRP